MLIDKDDFASALAEAADIEPRELRKLAGSGEPRSYYVKHAGKLISMKAVARLAYKRLEKDWDGPHSATVAAALRSHFDIVHLTLESEQQRLERQREVVERWSRPRQATFRVELLLLYDGKCVVTGCTSLDAIDAAHIQGVDGVGDDTIENGLILRADLHRLFDVDLMAIDPIKGTVRFDASCAADYAKYKGKAVHFPEGGPTSSRFTERWERFLARSEAL